MIRILLLRLIRLYQIVISPLLGPVCRFEPSCSSYAAASIELHGVLRGSLLSVVRLCKCHPFHPGGYDPPPPRGASLRMWRGSSASSPLTNVGACACRKAPRSTRWALNG